MLVAAQSLADPEIFVAGTNVSEIFETPLLELGNASFYVTLIHTNVWILSA
jgi:hypothetical protein